MTESRPLGFYSGVCVVAYLTWAVIFISFGHWAATLATTDARTAIDQAIPLWEWTVWIYDFCYIIPVAIVLTARDGHQLNRLLLAIFVATFASFVVYVAFPIAYPEPDFSDSISGRFLAWQFSVDFQPGANKMPSMHVANAFMIWQAARSRGTLWSRIYLAMAVLITLSTLTTHRHLVADAVLGIPWAFGAWWVAGRIYRPYQELEPREGLLRFLRLKPTS